MPRLARLTCAAALALALPATVGAGAASAQTTPRAEDQLGALVGALFGDRLGLSAMDQAWLRGGRPLRDGQNQFTSRIDSSVRSWAVIRPSAA